jgi:hypothetical protein
MIALPAAGANFFGEHARALARLTREGAGGAVLNI